MHYSRTREDEYENQYTLGRNMADMADLVRLQSLPCLTGNGPGLWPASTNFRTILNWKLRCDRFLWVGTHPTGSGSDPALSACALTQMSFRLRDVLGDASATLGPARFSLVRTHLATLLGLTARGGTALLVTDLTSSSSFPLRPPESGRSWFDIYGQGGESLAWWNGQGGTQWLLAGAGSGNLLAAAPLSVRATYPAVFPFDHAIRSPGGVAETPASWCPPDPATSCTRCACGVPAAKVASNGLSSTM